MLTIKFSGIISNPNCTIYCCVAWPWHWGTRRDWGRCWTWQWRSRPTGGLFPWLHGQSEPGVLWIWAEIWLWHLHPGSTGWLAGN